MLKWGVLGAGSVAHRRAMPAINEADNAVLFSLFNRTEEKAKQMAEEHGAGKYYTSVDELIADEELDALYISSPTYLHCEHVLKAAERGLEVLCEKPMAMNVEECEKMIKACDENDVSLQVCFLFRFHSIFRNIKKLIDEGELGEIIEVRMPILKTLRVPEGGWRIVKLQGGGGALMDLAAHSVDMFRYLLGEISEVSAFCSTFINDYDVEETGTIMLRMANGAHAITDTSFVAAGCDIVFEIYGTKGWVLVYNDNGWMVKTVLNGEAKVEKTEWENLYRAQFEHIARCVAREEDPIVTGMDGLKNIQALNAAYEAAETGKVIKL